MNSNGVFHSRKLLSKQNIKAFHFHKSQVGTREEGHILVKDRRRTHPTSAQQQFCGDFCV
jgi:hypothetical protein